MQYLTYEEYKKIGGTLDETAFNRKIMRACGEIDNRTKNRVRVMNEIPNNVKSLCADLVEYYVENLSGKATTSKSSTSGPVSESESYAVKTPEDVENDIENMFFAYLGSATDDRGTSLLYRGCGI